MTVRRLFTVLVAVLALALGAGEAGAKKKKKAPPKKAAKVKVVKAPKADTKAVAELMGPFKWGMSKDEVLGVLGKQIDEKYAERVKMTSDVFQQDKLRKEATAEKKRIASTWIEFGGKKTSWDVSIIEREFGQKNDEAMFVNWENDAGSKKDQRRFFFFVDGKLWKMFIAFNMDMFQGKTFADFQGIMETRYGKAASETKDDVAFIHWRAPGYYLRAIDLTGFYGNFCIAISDDSVESTIYARREERNPKQAKTNVIVDSVTEGKNQKDESKPSLEDPNSDVVDRITGGK